LVGSQGVYFYVGYYGTSTWTTPRNTGSVTGTGTAWTLSNLVKAQPVNVAGWHQVRFTLVAGETTSDFRIYNFCGDPRLRR